MTKEDSSPSLFKLLLKTKCCDKSDPCARGEEDIGRVDVLRGIDRARECVIESAPGEVGLIGTGRDGEFGLLIDTLGMALKK